MFVAELGEPGKDPARTWRYLLSPSRLRPRHIHYLVTAPGHRPLATQLYFAGDPHLEGHPFVRRSLVVPIATTPAKGGRGRWSVDFDVTLAPL